MSADPRVMERRRSSAPGSPVGQRAPWYPDRMRRGSPYRSCRRALLALASLALASACGGGPESSASSATGESTGESTGLSPIPANITGLCGQPGPVRILDVDPDEWLPGTPKKIGDRIVLAVSDGDPLQGSTLWSVRVCGDPVYLTDGVLGDALLAPPWPELALVRREAASPGIEFFALDPTGVVPPKALASGYSSLFQSGLSTAEGLIVFDWGDGAYFDDVTLYRYTDGDAPGLAPAVSLSAQGRDVVLLDDELFFVELGDSSLVHVPLSDLTQTLVATSVSVFAASSSHLLMIDGGEAHLRDRESGDETIFSLSPGADTVEIAAETAAITFDDSDGGLSQTILASLETGAHFVYPDVRPVGRVPDGRWALVGDIELSLADPHSGDRKVLSESLAEYATVEIAEDGLVVVDDSDSKVRLIPYTGGDEETLAWRSSYDLQRLSDGRVVTLVYGGDEGGDLVVVDRDTLDEHVIDTAVGQLWVAGADLLPPDIVAYTVRDGERSGLYLVNLGDEAYP